MATYRQFFTDVLTQLGLPATNANLIALGAVAHLEGLNDRYNPLNSVVPSGNSTSFNSVGVQDYKSYQNGVTGTVKLLQGSPWTSVVDALREGNSTGSVLAAFTTTYAGWGSHVSFNASSGSSVLNQSLGSGTPAGGTGGTTAKVNAAKTIAGPPPFTLDTLPAMDKLTDAQWISIRAWSLKFDLAIAPGSISIDAYSPNWDSGTKDYVYQNYKESVQIYNGSTNPTPVTQNSPSPGIIPDWVGGLGKALDWITTAHNWIRIGEFALAVVIVMFALYLLFKDDLPKVIPI